MNDNPTTPEKPRINGAWVSVKRDDLNTVLLLAWDGHPSHSSIEAIRRLEALASSAATAALGIQEGERIAELERELSAAHEKYQKWCAETMARNYESVKRDQAAIASHARTIEALRAALEPFCGPGGGADMQAYHDLEDDVVVWENSGEAVTAGDVRAARRLMAQHTNSPVSEMHFRPRPEGAPQWLKKQ